MKSLSAMRRNTLPGRFRLACILTCVTLAALLFTAQSQAQISVHKFKNPAGPKKADLVVVFKSKRELYLFRDGTVIDRYPIALGYDPVGPKHRRGDDKTPVGDYVINWRNPNSRFDLSLHISYPDASDRAYARRHGFKPGKNIMIHGQPDYSTHKRHGDWTHGCIAVSDKAIKQIWRLVPNGTPIQIYK